MRFERRIAALLAAASLAACGGGAGGTAAVPPRTAQGDWIAALRYEPALVNTTMSSSTLSYIYVDSGATNGVYPSPSAFAAEIEAANPRLLDGECSKVARITSALMQFTDARGVAAPSYVLFFWPKAPGTCTQAIDLGTEGRRSFSVTVTP
jgi:hypothetical protein